MDKQKGKSNSLNKILSRPSSVVPELPRLNKSARSKIRSDQSQMKHNNNNNFLPDLRSKYQSKYFVKSEGSTISTEFSQDSLSWLANYNFYSNKSDSESYRSQKVKFFVNNKNLTKLKALMTKTDKINNSQNEQILSLDENKKKHFRFKFKKIVKILIIVLRLINLHKITKAKILYSLNLNNIDSNEMIFKKSDYDRPTEPPFPDEAKRLLELNPSERTDEMIRQIIISLSFSVPEFLDFPIYMQRMIAKFSFYAEFDPNRVIIRQGHIPENYYFVISGIALELKNSLLQTQATPVSVFKRGDSFGDKAIIKNTLRLTSVTVSGNRPICLLYLEKEEFYKIQTPVSNEKERMEFLETKVKLLNMVKYDFKKLVNDNRNNQALCSIYFKNGQIICEDSQKDDWIYIVKSGGCKVLKKVKFDKEALKSYLDFNERNKEMKQFLNLHETGSKVKTGLKRKDLPSKSLKLTELKSDDVYLEMIELKEGDIFGLHDVVLSEEDDKKIPLFLTSLGCECIMINRKYFLKHLQSQSLYTLRFNLHPYPTDDYLIKKYFNSYKWKDFASECKIEALKKIDDKKSNKILYF
ncbi:unnamed protein product [Brachionus calyciflorus]|uniref:Cyclic nucleotide-binding domain-containing protein n=1 Tax=Brachionus calyciflorus TaxID=104777 RepID=A0A813YED3_9BILA|nr:unnamed protein product [Brachionus calyciflorus]